MATKRLCRQCFVIINKGYNCPTCNKKKVKKELLRNAKIRNKTVYDSKWRRTRAAYLKLKGGFCEMNGCGRPANEVDHILSIRLGGAKYDFSNLQVLCRYHHKLKTIDDSRMRPEDIF